MAGNNFSSPPRGSSSHPPMRQFPQFQGNWYERKHKPKCANRTNSRASSHQARTWRWVNPRWSKSFKLESMLAKAKPHCSSPAIPITNLRRKTLEQSAERRSPWWPAPRWRCLWAPLPLLQSQTLKRWRNHLNHIEELPQHALSQSCISLSQMGAA